ncbi:MAG: alpha/beta fold hydrolase [Dehalococcoidia bacterium]|nr:alpha/beta fold hydrolase [Dehalococcoidia bacterium]
MNNNVVNAIVSALTERRIGALKFNFRGTGQSTGAHDDGNGEQDDIIAALDFLSSQQGIDSRRLGIAGYSFGGMVAARLAGREGRIKALALVSPALSQPELDRLKDLPQPVLVISGGRDDFVPPGSIRALADRLSGASAVEIVALADHFWYGHEKIVASKVADFLLSRLRDTSQA